MGDCAGDAAENSKAASEPAHETGPPLGAPCIVGRLRWGLVVHGLLPATKVVGAIVWPNARIGHDAAFAAFTRRFLAYVADPRSLPVREGANILAKYRVTTGAVALSRS